MTAAPRPKRQGIFSRIPADLHAELTRRAAEQDVSLNMLVVSLLAGAVGFKLKDSSRAGGTRDRSAREQGDSL